MRDIRIEEKIPKYILDICDVFHAAGEEAYLVGGSLRDIMLGREPNDFDLATSALPQRTAELFSHMRVIETGIRHGTVTVISHGHPVEITTFRIDGEYTDSRHPDGVRFTGRIEEDLARRDFTVNAMAYNHLHGLIDPFGGRDDLKGRVIRAVGESRKRFSEDALRIMRCFRFSAQLDFDICRDTLEGAAECRSGLGNIAKERIASELVKLLTSPDPAPAIRKMMESGVMPFIVGDYLPEDKVISLISEMPTDAAARLGFFLSSADESEAKAILMDLKYSGAITTGAMAVARGATKRIEGPAGARRFIGECGIHAKNGAVASALLGNSPAEAVEWISRNRAPCTLRELAVNGRDLMDIGIEGKSVGSTLNKLLEAVIDDPRLNEREILLRMCRK